MAATVYDFVSECAIRSIQRANGRVHLLLVNELGCACVSVRAVDWLFEAATLRAMMGGKVCFQAISEEDDRWHTVRS